MIYLHDESEFAPIGLPPRCEAVQVFDVQFSAGVGAIPRHGDLHPDWPRGCGVTGDGGFGTRLPAEKNKDESTNPLSGSQTRPRPVKRSSARDVVFDVVSGGGSQSVGVSLNNRGSRTA